MNLLSILWFVSSIGGVVAATAGLVVRWQRRPSLWIAGACFLVAGILGLASIGILFVILALLCFFLASRAPERTTRRPADTTAD